MCLGCQCPEEIPAPDRNFQKYRLWLKGLALGLLVIMVFNFVIINIIGALYSGFLIYFLYLGWAQFNFCSVLFFFIFCLVQSITYLLLIVGRIEFPPFFGGSMDTFEGIVAVIGFTYYTIAIGLSHHIYKHFKNRQIASGGGVMGGFGGIVPGQGNNAAGMNGYRGAMNDRVQEPQRQVPNRGFQAFQGQGVAIG